MALAEPTDVQVLDRLCQCCEVHVMEAHKGILVCPECDRLAEMCL